MNIVNYLFKTKNGEIVFGQKPNLPIIIAGVSYLVSWITNDNFSLLAAWIGRIAIIYWAFLEISSGINLFRRIMGVVVLCFVLLSFILNNFSNS